MAEKLKLISWNVNGIRAITKKGFGDFLTQYQPDIIGLQEVKIDDASRAKTSFDFADYEEYWNPARRPGYSGTAILTKQKPLTIKIGLGDDEFDQEGRVITAEYPQFYFVDIYFPNVGPELARMDYRLRFNDALLKFIKKLEETKPVVLCGDFNVAHEEIDIARPKENVGHAGFTAEERAWADELVSAGFIDTFRQLHPEKIQYSWWSYRQGARERNVGWRIDYFFLSPALLKNVTEAFIIDEVLGSDHAPVGIVLEF